MSHSFEMRDMSMMTIESKDFSPSLSILRPERIKDDETLRLLIADAPQHDWPVRTGGASQARYVESGKGAVAGKRTRNHQGNTPYVDHGVIIVITSIP